MKKLIAIALAIVMVLTLSLGASVTFAAAQKLDLRENPPTWGVPPSGNPVVGFVVLNNDNDSDSVVVVVSLKEGFPIRTYAVFLEEYRGPSPDGRMPKYEYLGDFTTTVKGKGNFKAEVARSVGPHYLQVVVSYPWGSWGAKSFGTDIAAITIK